MVAVETQCIALRLKGCLLDDGVSNSRWRGIASTHAAVDHLIKLGDWSDDLDPPLISK